MILTYKVPINFKKFNLIAANDAVVNLYLFVSKRTIALFQEAVLKRRKWSDKSKLVVISRYPLNLIDNDLASIEVVNTLLYKLLDTLEEGFIYKLDSEFICDKVFETMDKISKMKFHTFRLEFIYPFPSKNTMAAYDSQPVKEVIKKRKSRQN